MTESGAGGSLIVYDLDGVITRKDSFTALVLTRLRASPVQLFKSVLAATSMLNLKQHDRHRVARRIAEIALTGLTSTDYCHLADAFGRRIGADPRWIRAETVARIQSQHANGARIVIATATERRLAESLLSSARVPYHELSASLLAVASNGMRVADHRVGERKTEALLELGVPIATAEFVTDSTTDFPTARAAASVTLIGASKQTIRHFTRAELLVR